MRTNRILMASCAIVVCLGGGCASTGFLKVNKEDFPTAGPKQPVIRIIDQWAPADGVGVDDRVCRGFGGQINFVVEGSDVFAKVDGSVSIYLFDDQGTVEEQRKAIH